MERLTIQESKKIVKAYQDGFITVNELKEQLQWYRHGKTHIGTQPPVKESTANLIPHE